MQNNKHAEEERAEMLVARAESSVPVVDEWNAQIIRADLDQVAHRVAMAVPRISAWAGGAKIPVRAGLFVSRAKTMAAYMIALGFGQDVAINLIKQLNAADPTRADYRLFVEAVVAVLEVIDEHGPAPSVEVVQ